MYYTTQHVKKSLQLSTFHQVVVHQNSSNNCKQCWQTAMAKIQVFTEYTHAPRLDPNICPEKVISHQGCMGYMCPVPNKFTLDKHKPESTGSLPKVITVAVNHQYDIISNIVVQDGIMNGAECCIKYIQPRAHDSTFPAIVWVQFEDS